MAGATVALDLTWHDLDSQIAALAAAVRADGIPEVVVGILRGGMAAAVLVAHQLGVRDVRAVAVTRTLSEQPNGAKSPAPVVANPASLGRIASGADVLLVDDVAGSGATLDTAAGLVRPAAGRLRRAVVVVNTVNWALVNSRAPHDLVDYVGTTCAGWVRFPWEVR